MKTILINLIIKVALKIIDKIFSDEETRLQNQKYVLNSVFSKRDFTTAELREKYVTLKKRLDDIQEQRVKSREEKEKGVWCESVL